MDLFEPQAVGVGFGGPVDWQTGRIARSHQIEGWADFNLVNWLRSIVNKPTFVDNDANVAALGEAFRGAGIGSNPVFYVTLGSGVGGGLIVNGQIYHGAKPGESEVGHLRLDRQGTTLESRCSGWAVDAKIRQLISTEPASILSRQMVAPWEPRPSICPKLASGDRRCKILERLRRFIVRSFPCRPPFPS